MKSRLFVNPVSGNDKGPDLLPLINERLRANVGELDIVITTGAGDATRAAEQAVRERYDRLFVAGGDGTLNEVLNGIAAVRGGFEQTTIGVVPLGTGNDFATALGVPSEVEAALDWLAAAAPTPLDVGILNERYFINVSGGGFIAEVSDAVDPQLKTIAGKLAYIIGGAQVLMTHEPVHATVQGIGAEARMLPSVSLNLHAFAVCNAPLIGGGRLIAPEAIMDDGLLDVCLIEAMPTLDFVALLTRVSNGEHVHDDRVRYFRAARLEMRFNRSIKVNTDGQVLEADRCTYRIFPAAARFLARPTHSRPRVARVLAGGS
jgi:diacylglycerol kinase (ATP)